MGAKAFTYPLLWQYYLLFWIIGALGASWPLPCLLCALALFFVERQLRLSRCFLFALFFTALGFVCVKWHINNSMNEAAPPWLKNDAYYGRVCGEIDSTRGMPGNRMRISLINVRPEGKNDAIPLSGPVFWNLENPPPGFRPLTGQHACIKNSLKKPHPGLNNPDDIASWQIRGPMWHIYSNGDKGSPAIAGSPETLALTREKARERFMAAMAWPHKEADLSQSQAILPALLFGDRQFLSRETVADFASATLAHSLALSGQHLEVAALFGICIIFFMGMARPGIYLTMPRAALTSLASLPFAVLYLWIGNSPPSLMRAAGMLFLFAFFIWRGSPFTGRDLLCAALLIILAAKPMAIYDVGLQLSAMCVALILLFLPAINRHLPGGKGVAATIIRASLQILAISLLMQIFLLPVNISRFSIAGLWFPLNLIWLPVLGFFVLPAAVCGLILALLPGCFFMAASHYFLYAAAVPCQWLLHILDFMRAHNLLAEPSLLRPHVFNFVAFAILAGVLAWLAAKKRVFKEREKALPFIMAALTLMIVPPLCRLLANPLSGPKLEALDVGQGLALYMHLPGNIRLLYDGGGGATSSFDPGKSIVAPYLANNAPPELDAVINSHPDVDHLGGLFHILEKFSVKTIFHNGHEARGNALIRWDKWRSNPKARTLFAGDIIKLGNSGLYFEVLHPPASGIPMSDGSKSPDLAWFGNHASLVMRLCKNGDGLALFTGDAEKDTINYLLKKGVDLQAKVVFAPHHGSDRSLVPEFYKKAAPRLVIASCGYLNQWKYPGKKLLAFLRENGVPLLDTASKGRISLEFDGDNNIKANALLDKE